MDEVEPAGVSPRARRGIALMAVALVGLAAGVAAYLWSVAPHPYSGPPPPPTSLAIPVSMDWHTGAQGWLVVHDAGGPESVLFRTGDGGRHWARQLSIGGPAFVRFTDARHGTLRADPTQASGARLLRSDDGGAAWQPVAPPPLTGGTATASYFLDTVHGWLLAWNAGSGVQVYATGDGGGHWAPLAAVAQPAPLRDVVFASATSGWLYGGALLVTRDGGATWTPVALAAGPTPGDQLDIGAPTMAEGGAGVLPVTDRDTGRGWLYSSADGGVTWDAPLALPGGADRTTAFSPGAAGGWTWDGTSAWLTVDSGRTWQQAAGLPAGWRFSTISPVGAREAWATAVRDGATGSLGPTRWALYHTVDGGRHWTRGALPSLA